MIIAVLGHWAWFVLGYLKIINEFTWAQEPKAKVSKLFCYETGITNRFGVIFCLSYKVWIWNLNKDLLLKPYKILLKPIFKPL